MFGIGMAELMILIGLVVVVVAGGGVVRRLGGLGIHGRPLVLQRFAIDEGESAKTLVDLAGRTSGITSWLLTRLGFDAETSLKVTDTQVSFMSSSLWGQAFLVSPLTSVSSTHCGYSKPIGHLIWGAIFMIGGAAQAQRGGNMLALSTGLIIGGAFLVAYYLSKRIYISIETSGGSVSGLSFKRSVIENVGVDIEQALKAASIINRKLIESQAGARISS